MSAQLQLPMTEKQRRLTQLEAVECCMSRSDWKTLKEIVAGLWYGWGMRASEAGVSARLRDLRKLGYTVDRRRRSGNLWEYHVER